MPSYIRFSVGADMEIEFSWSQYGQVSVMVDVASSATTIHG